MKTVKIVCNILLGIVVTAALALAAVLGIPVLLGDQLYAVQTSSMEPAYPVGSLVMVKPVQAQDVKVGDVITFTASGFETPVTHRVIEVDSAAGTFITKGDNNENADFYPVPFENLEGRVRLGIPFLGNLVAGLQTVGGWLVVAWGVFFIALLLFLPDLLERLKTGREAGPQPMPEMASPAGQPERKPITVKAGKTVFQASAAAKNRPAPPKQHTGSYKVYRRAYPATLRPESILQPEATDPVLGVDLPTV